MNGNQPIQDVIHAEVTGVSRETKYLEGYSKPATTMVFLKLEGKNSSDGLRSVVAVLPGDLPIGTRFKVTIEQVDTVDSAVIHRGALPIIEDRKTLIAEKGPEPESR